MALREAPAFELDRTSREIRDRGRRIRLSEKPFRVLEALVEARGEVVSRESLRTRLWSDDTFVDFDNNLNSAVATLRQALSDSARAPRYIETIPKVGYRLLVLPLEPVRPSARSRSIFLRVSSAVLGVAAVMAIGLWQRPPTATPGGDGEPVRSDHPGAQSAYERGLYLRGKFQIQLEPPSLLTGALESFAEARRLDEAFVPAVAEVAETWVEMSFAGLVDFREGLERAREAAEESNARSKSNGTSLRVLAMTALFLEWDLRRAREHLDGALQVDALDPRTALAEATFAAAAGRPDDAVRAAERAVALEPSAYYVKADLALFYLAAGRNEEAARSARRVLDVQPNFTPALFYGTLAWERLGRWQDAADAARKLMELAGAAEAFRERVGEAEPREALRLWRQWEVARAESLASDHPGEPDAYALHLALRYAVAGERGAALEQLERAYQRHDALLIFLPAFPEVEELRGDPRFERLARRLRKGVS
jgi:tetratricopeptide (TPR) repeat protein